MLKKILSNRIFQFVLVFVAGGLAATFLTPEKIIIKRDEKIVYKDKIVEKEVVKYVDRVVEKEVKVVEKVKSVKRKETFPDGHIIEEEIYESESEQIARITEQEKERYQELLAEATSEYEQQLSYYKSHTNPKRFTIFAGGGTRIDDPLNYNITGGMDAQLWGPFVIGAQANSQKDFAVTLGLRF